MSLLAGLTSSFIWPLLALSILLFFGAFIMYMRPEKRVELLRPRDSRGRTLKVVQENDLMLICKKVGGVTHRFIKAGQGWTFNSGGKMITKFFGMEGTMYTPSVKEEKVVKISVSDFLKNIWTLKAYNEMPREMKDPIESDVWGVTVEVEKIDEENLELPNLRGDDVHDEGDSIVLKRLTEEVKGTGGGSIKEYILVFLVGASVMYFLVSKGYV